MAAGETSHSRLVRKRVSKISTLRRILQPLLDQQLEELPQILDDKAHRYPRGPMKTGRTSILGLDQVLSHTLDDHRKGQERRDVDDGSMVRCRWFWCDGRRRSTRSVGSCRLTARRRRPLRLINARTTRQHRLTLPGRLAPGRAV